MSVTETERPTGIRCGNCTGRHATVAEVRTCHGQSDTVQVDYRSEAAATRAGASREDLRLGRVARFASEKQVRWIVSMLESKGIPSALSGTTELIRAQCEAHDIDVRSPGDGARIPLDIARNAIELLKPLPFKGREAGGVTYADIPAGHYAVESLTGNNDLDFFRIDRPDHGTYAGRIFVKRIIGGKPDVGVRGKAATLALEAILNAPGGPEMAAKLYGVEIGRCYKCNRRLTDATSRAAGIGPDCAGRL